MKGHHQWGPVNPPSPSGLHAKTKPDPDQWIRGRHMKDKLNLLSWLIDGKPDCYNTCGKLDEPISEYQTFDGFFNNLFKVDLGAVGKFKFTRRH